MVNATMNKIIKIYLTLTIILTICGRIIPVKIMIGNRTESVLYALLAGFGAILLLVDLFTTRVWYKGNHVFILYAFIGVMCISSILNFDYGIINNAKTIVWTTIQFGIIYTLYLRYTKKEMFEFMRKIWLGISITWFFPVCYSIWQFITLQGYRVTGEIRQGFIEHRLFGIFNDPNYAAVMSLGVIIACIYLSKKFSNRYLKVFFCINIIVQTIYISLSGSRTALLVFIVISIVFLWLKLYCKKWKYKSFVKLIVGVLIPVIVISATFALNSAIQKVAVIFPQTYSNFFFTTEEGEEKPDLAISDTTLERTDNRTISNNRVEIWKNYIAGMEGDWLFGGSPRNVLEKWIDKDPDGYLSITNYETHNGYLLVLVSTGIIGFLVMLCFAILCTRDFLKYIKKAEYFDDEFLFTLIFIIINIAYAFFFTDLFFIHNYTTVLFWLHCGILQYWCSEKRISFKI